MFEVVIVDGRSVIDISEVQDLEVERLQIELEGGQVFVFKLVDYDEFGKFFEMDLEASDASAIQHAHDEYYRHHAKTEQFKIYFGEWSSSGLYGTDQPTEGDWLRVHAGFNNRPINIQGIHLSLPGGPITKISSVAFEPQA